MAFIKENFSPLGASARAGHTDALGIDPTVENAPQIFSYVTQDPISMVTVPGYFNEMKGAIQRGDWVDIQSDIDGTIRQSIHFFTADGESPSVFFTAIISGGSGYAVGDTIVPTISTGTVIHKPTYTVGTLSGPAVSALFFPDAGLFDPRDMPTDFTVLATTTDGSGTGCTVTLYPTSSTAGILTAAVNAAGTGYAVDDILEVTVVTGTVLSQPKVKVLTLSGSGLATLSIEDPGSFAPNNIPTGLTALATVALTGAGSGGTVDITVPAVVQGFAIEAEEGDINVSQKSIVAG